MEYKNNKVFLTEDSGGSISEDRNFIEYEGGIFHLRYLNPQFKSSKGANSSVFILYDKNGNYDDRVIKISNIFRPGRGTSPSIRRRYGRFIKEIKALQIAKENKLENIVTIDFDSEIEIDDKTFPYYVMEKADTDVKEYLVSNPELDNQEKMKLCISIFSAIKSLHLLGIYHRDIKPDNVLLFIEENGEGDENNRKFIWKIGDLGLIAERNKDYDDIGERIGPFGWISPEAMNKYLTEKANLGFDCKIDDKSDIFQLGNLFWFIFQLNAPIGLLFLEDFTCITDCKEDIYDIIEKMLQYSKPRRINLYDIESKLTNLGREFGI